MLFPPTLDNGAIVSAGGARWRGVDGVKGSREAYWRGQVAAWKRSGESVRGYCRSRGLSEAGFHFWKRELKRRDAGTASEPEQPAFAEVRLPSSAVHDALIEISVSGSRRIHVHPGFDEETLLRVIAALERVAC